MVFATVLDLWRSSCSSSTEDSDAEDDNDTRSTTEPKLYADATFLYAAYYGSDTEDAELHHSKGLLYPVLCDLAVEAGRRHNGCEEQRFAAIPFLLFYQCFARACSVEGMDRVTCGYMCGDECAGKEGVVVGMMSTKGECAGEVGRSIQRKSRTDGG